jgi:hypothetical protein
MLAETPASAPYDLQGNLTSKTGVGTYSYLAGSHRLGIAFANPERGL